MSKSILIIDADQPFTASLEPALKSSGFGVHVLGDGKDALDVARAKKPNLVVLCVELPNMSGYSICNKLKKDEDLKGIPLIITSSEATPETFAQHKKLKTRAEEYLIKPFGGETLVERVGALIGLPQPAAAAAEEVVASGGDELDFDSLTAPPPAEATSLDAGEDPLAGLELSSAPDPLAGLEALDAPPPTVISSPAKAAQKSTVLVSSAADLDDLLGGGGPSKPTPAAPPPKPTPSIKPLASVPPRPAATLPPRSSTSTLAAVGADSEALKESRKENADLKARVVTLEGKLKLAEDQLQRAQASTETGKSSAQSSAKELLGLKEQINSRDKELLKLRDEVFAKEKEVVERSDQLAEAEQRASAAEAVRAELETQVASLESRVQSAEQHLAEVEGAAEQRQADMVAQLEDLQSRAQNAEAVEAELQDLRARLEQAEANLKAAQDDSARHEERLIKAHKRLKQDEQVREKLRRALDIAQQLVTDGVVGDADEPSAEA